VADVLRSDWLTTGPKVDEFERALMETVATSRAVAVSSGTTALLAAMHALEIAPGDEVIVPALTFMASANCAVWFGAKPVAADVQPRSLLLDPEGLEEKINSRTKAIIAVDYAGNVCDYDRLDLIAQRHGLALVADACHSLGGSYNGKPSGSLARLSAFSFHPVKHVAGGEGGAVTTDDARLAKRVRQFRNHGMAARGRGMVELGLNGRMSDIHCALATSQLAKLQRSISRRREIAARYDRAFAELPQLDTPAVAGNVSHAHHLYLVRLDLEKLRVDRDRVLEALRGEGIGATVHYLPFHLHDYYREHFGTAEGDCPVAEDAARRILSLPMFPGMSDSHIDDVISAMHKVIEAYRR
jgi:perosamine synthetase